MMVHEEDRRRMLDELSGGRLEYDDALLAPANKHDMIARLLRNLKAAYLREQDDANALLAVERLLVMRPGDPEEIRDRGLLRYRMRRYGLSLDDLNDYLKRRADAPDQEQIEAHIAHLRQIVAAMN